MHEDCKPAFMSYARCVKLVCFGGEAAPFQHDKIWVELPLSFQGPSPYSPEMGALHDKFLALWPEGGHHKHSEQAEPVEKATMSVQLEGKLLERFQLYCHRAGYSRGAVIRGLLSAVFIQPNDERAAETFKSFRDDAAKRLG